MRGIVIIETDAEIGKVALVFLAHARDERLRADALLLGAQHHRRAVGVVGADVVTFVPAHFLEAHPDIGLNVFHEVPEVKRAVGVGQGAGDEDFAFFLGHKIVATITWRTVLVRLTPIS